MKTLVMVWGLALAVAGCGGGKAEGGGEPKTAANENAPAPPSDEDIQKHQQNAATPPPSNGGPTHAAAQKIAADERADFDAAFAKWEAAKKAGTVMQDCKSLASSFESVARGHKTLAAQAYFNAGTLLDQ